MDNRDLSLDKPTSTATPLVSPSSKEKKTETSDTKIPKGLLEQAADAKAQGDLKERQITLSSEKMLDPAKTGLKGAVEKPEIERSETQTQTKQIDHRLAAVFLGDSFIKEASFKGESLEGASELNTFSLIREILIEEQKKNKDNGKVDPFIDSMIRSVNQMLDAAMQLQRSNSKDFHKWITDKISQLKEGESLAFPGGWKAVPAGHLIVNEITRQKGKNKDKFVLKIYNTGDGVAYHPSVIDDNQTKYNSSLTIEDISLETLLRQEVWNGYHLLKTTLPQPGEPSYSSKDYYEGFIRSIKPAFTGPPIERGAVAEKNYMRGARAGICTVDAFRTFMRGHGSTQAYKSTDFIIKQAVLEKYFAFLNNTGILNPPKNLKTEDIQNNLGALQLTEDFAVRLAQDIGVGVDHKWISDQEVKGANSLISKVCEKVKVAIAENKRLYVESSPNIQLVSDKSEIEFENVDPKPEIESPKDLNTSTQPAVKPLILNTNWERGKTKELLKSWTAAVVGMYPSDSESRFDYKFRDYYKSYDAEVNRITDDIFSKMPPADDPYWEQIPDQDRDECMILISNLSEHFVRTRPAIQNGHVSHIDQIYNMQKVLGVMKKLANLLPDDGSGFYEAALQTSFLSVDNHLEGKDRRIIVKESRLENALVGSSKILNYKKERKGERGERGFAKMFERSFDFASYKAEEEEEEEEEKEVAVVHGDPIHKIEHVSFSDKYKEGHTRDDEILLVYEYLEKHPEVKNLIKEKLQKESPGLLILPSHIVALALTDLSGEYLPKAFCAFKKQFYLTRWFVENSVDAYDPFSSYQLGDNQWREPLIHLRVDVTSENEVRIRPTFRLIHFWNEKNPVKATNRELLTNNPVVKLTYEKLTSRNRFDLSSNRIMLDEESHKFSTPAQGEECRALQSIIEGPSQIQIIKTIAFFNKNLNKLIDPDYQLLFQHMIFECGKLHKQLKEYPDFAITLSDLVKRGYEYALGAKNNIAAAVFFLRMGSYFESYCKYIFSDKIKPSQPYQFLSVPHTLQSLNKSSNELPLDEKSRAKSLIARELLAYYGRENLPDSIEEQSELLKASFLLSEHPIIEKDPQFDQDLDKQVRNTFQKFALRLKNTDPKQISEILSLAVGKTSVEWNLKEFPNIASMDGTYRIDLLKGQLDVAGYTGNYIPVRVSQNELFQKLFPNQNVLKNVKAMGPYACRFVDDKERENQIGVDPNNISINNFKKNINGVWCDLRLPASGDKLKEPSAILENCSRWQTRTEPKQIFFLDKKTEKVSYVYDFAQKRLTCVDEGIRHNLHLVDMKLNNPSYQFFLKCDPQAQIWKDGNDKIQFVELPTYGVLLPVDNSTEPPRINAPENLPGFFLSKNQLMPLLHRFSGYLVFENEKGEKQVLIPRKEIARTAKISSYSESLEYEKSEKKPEAYFYQINTRGKLISGTLKQNLYLAFLYVVKKDYGNAQKILYKMAAKPTAYSEEEIDLLLKIANSGVDYEKQEDVRAIALRLKAFSLILDHKKKPGNISLTKEQVDDRKKKENEFVEKVLKADMENYLGQLFHLPSTYAFTSEEEIALLTRISEADLIKFVMLDSINKRRLNALNQIPTKKTPLNESEKKEEAEKIDTGWVQGFSGVIKASIDEGILDKFTNCIQPPKNFLSENFLSLYSIAKSKNEPEKTGLMSWIGLGKSKSGSQRDRLTSLMAWINSPPEAVRFAEIIEGVLREPSKFPTLEEIQVKLKELSSGDEGIGSLLKSLYVLAGPRKPWIKQNVAAINVRSVPRKTRLAFEKIQPKKVSLEADQKEQKEVSELEKTFRIPPIEPFFVEADPAKRDPAQQNARISLMAKLDKLKLHQDAQKENRVALRGINELRADFEIFSKTGKEEWSLQSSELGEFKDKLRKQCTEAKSALIQMEEKLRNLANQSPTDPRLALKRSLDIRGKKISEITVKELQLLFVRNNVKAYQARNPSLSLEDVQELNAKVEKFLVLATQSQQLDRIAQAITVMEQADDPSVQKELAQDIHRELSAKRTYDTQEHPEFLVFEYRKNLLMRQEQVDGIESLLNKKQETVLQIIMGGGKSDILLPLLALKKADGEALSIIMVPSELIDTVSETMHVGSGKIFAQVANRINWKDTSLEGLKDIYERLKLIKDNREFLLVTSKEMHDFGLALREARLNHITGKAIDKSRLEEFYKIKQLLKDKGDAIIDEVDSILRCDLEVHKALGEDERINPLYSSISTKIYETIMTDKRVTDKVYFEFSSAKYPKGDKAKPFTAKEFPALKNVIGMEALAHLRKQKIPHSDVETYSKEMDTYESQIHKYVFAEAGEKVSLPESISQDLKEALAFIRSQIHIFLPSTLDKLHKENFGVFPSTLIAGPYENTQPHYGSQFGHYTEQINYTIQSYLKTGIPKEQVKIVFKRMQNDARMEWKGNPLLKQSDLGGYKEFLELFGENEAARKMASSFDFLTHDEKEIDGQIDLATKALSEDPKRILQFLGSYILPKITSFNMRMTSNAQMLPDMFHRVQGVTGTVEKDKDTFHPRFTTVAAEGISGKTISLLWKNSKDLIQTLKNEKPLEMLSEMVKSENKDLHAIMDAGALFKDISHETLAHEILKIRKDLEAVIFYEGNKPMILRRKKDDYIIREYTAYTDVQTSKRFTIYDQPHCTGANFRQAPTAHAWITMNKNQNFRDMSQAAWRMRGIEKGQKVGIFLQKGLDETIKNNLGMPADAKLDVLDPMLYAIKVQGQRQGEDNLKSIRQKLDNIVFQAIDGLLDAIAIDDLSLPMYKQLNELTLTILKDSPYEQFGNVETKEEAQTVLNQFSKNAIKAIEEWHNRNKTNPSYTKYSQDPHIMDINKMSKSMQDVIASALNPAHPMVEERLSSRENNLTGVEVSVEVRQEITEKQEQEQEQDQEQVTQMSVKDLSTESIHAWSGLENMGRKDYFVPRIDAEGLAKSYPYTYSQLVSYSQDIPYKPLLSAKDAFATAPKGLLDNNLLLSANLLFTEKDGNLFGPFQKPFGPCLIIQSKTPGEPLKLLLLTDEDLINFKEALDKATGNQDQRISLFYPNVGIYQQKNDPIDPQIANDKEFKTLIAQYKFLSGETVAYTKEELNILRAWLIKQGNIKEVKEYFRTTLIKSATNAESFLNPSTPITSLFDELITEKTKQRALQIKNKLPGLLDDKANLEVAKQWNGLSEGVQNLVLRGFQDGLDQREDFTSYFKESVKWLDLLKQRFPGDQQKTIFTRIASLYLLAGPSFDYTSKQKYIQAFLDLSSPLPGGMPPLLKIDDWVNSSINPVEFQKWGPLFALIHSKCLTAFEKEEDRKLMWGTFEGLLKEVSATNNLAAKKVVKNLRDLAFLSPEHTSKFFSILKTKPSALDSLLKFRNKLDGPSFDYFINKVDLQNVTNLDLLENNINRTEILVKAAIRLNNPHLLDLFRFGCRNTMYLIMNCPGFVENYSRLLEKSDWWRSEEVIKKINDDNPAQMFAYQPINNFVTLCSYASYYPKTAKILLLNKYVNLLPDKLKKNEVEIGFVNRFLQKIENASNDEQRIFEDFLRIHEKNWDRSEIYKSILIRFLQLIDRDKLYLKTDLILTLSNVLNREYITYEGRPESDRILFSDKLVKVLESDNISFVQNVFNAFANFRKGLRVIEFKRSNLNILFNLYLDRKVDCTSIFDIDVKVNCTPIFDFLLKWSKSKDSPPLKSDSESLKTFWPLISAMRDKLMACPADSKEQCYKEITEIVNQFTTLKVDQPDLAEQFAKLHQTLK